MRFRRHHAARRAALLIFALACGGRAEDPVRFTETAGARAFREGRYAEAVAEFERLAETNPGHLLVLRYLAMSYDRAGRRAEALRVFARALALDPENVALLYHSGETLYHARYAEDARRHFLRVLALAPDSEYARRARGHLDAADRQVKEGLPPGPPPRFSIHAEVGWQRDDYRFPSPAPGADESVRADRLTEYLALRYVLVGLPGGTVALDASGYGAQALANREAARDLWQWGAGLSAQRTGAIGGVSAAGTFRAFYQAVRFDGGPGYGESLGATLQGEAFWAGRLLTQAHYRFTEDDFEDDGFDPAIASRDAGNHTAGLAQTVFLFDRRAWLTLAAEFQENRAEGRNYDYDGPAVRASASAPLPMGARLDAGYAYREECYRDFAGPVRRETERREWTAAVHRALGSRWLARLHYTDTDEESTIPELSYRRRVWGASLAYVY